MRSLVSLCDTSATALDYHQVSNHAKGGLNVAKISKGEESLDPASDGESDGDEYRATLEASSPGSYYNLRIQDRQHITGATSPLELENLQEAAAPSTAIRVVREILALKDVPKDHELLDRLADLDESISLKDDWLAEAARCFRERSDIQQEARLNQGGVAAFRAYAIEGKELIPYNQHFFGRGKK